MAYNPDWYKIPEVRERRRKQQRDRARERYHTEPEYREKILKRNALRDSIEYRRKYRDTHRLYFREKCRKRDAQLRSKEPVDYALVINNAQGICQICKTPFGDEKVEIDHIIPLAKGGIHALSNLQATHARCNRRKSARIL